MKLKLEDVCERGSSSLKQSDILGMTGDYPIYGASGYIGNVDFYHQEKPYVAIVKDGAGIGRTTFHPAKSSVIGTMQYLLPKDNVLPKYLYYVVGHMHLEKYFSGATIPHIYFKDYKSEEFNYDSLDKQKNIVEILGRCEKVISARKRELELLDSIIKARFVEMFGDIRENSNGYAMVPFIDIVEYMGDIGSNGANKVIVDHLDMKNEEDYAMMVRFTNFTKNDFTDDIKYVSKETYDFFKKSQIFGGELIICKIGSAGQNYVMPYLNRPVSLGLNQIMVRIKENILMPYLYQYLHTDYGEFLISGCINGAVTKTITKTELKKIPIMLPPMKLQNEFAEFVKQVDKSKLLSLIKLLEQLITYLYNVLIIYRQDKGEEVEDHE